MGTARNLQQTIPVRVPHAPAWITLARGENVEDFAFNAGAALAHLEVVLAQTDVPHALLRDRLALSAAETCLDHAGRPESAGALRDTVHLMRPDDLPGPAGETYLRWRRAVARPLSVKAMHRALPDIDPATLAHWLDAGTGQPVTRAAQVLEAVLTDMPQAEDAALILADAALAQGLGWGHLVPLLATGLKRSDLRIGDADLKLACLRAVTVSALATVPIAAELLRKTQRLKAVAPKLRAKGAEAAVDIFLTHDAVAASALPLPDRAARRLCDRLVTLGAVRELTGRDTFRLYGV